MRYIYKQISIFILLITIHLSSCTNPGNNSIDTPGIRDCERNRTGAIVITNTSKYPYDIYIDDVHKLRIQAKSKSDKLEIDEGNNRKIYVEQVTGYLFFPFKKTVHFNVVRCSDYQLSIP